MERKLQSKVEELIEKRKETYKDAVNAVSAFNRENELAKEYNGRQVLELIQNADDAEASHLSISLDGNKKTISIYNDGNPFTFEGIRSIMVGDYSTKTNGSYIGNKGLGFRSLLSWANTITIQTEDLCFKFSSEIARENAKELELKIEDICKDRKLSKNCCPFPILAIPRIEKSKNKLEKGCAIYIQYKTNFEKDIKDQLEQLDEASLFFLRNVNEIKLEINGNRRTISIKKEGNTINALGADWELISEEKDLPDEYQDETKEGKKRYFIAIAVPKDKRTQYFKFYNYLPTNESIGLPFLLHATVALNSSRNNLNQCKENEFILNQTAELISKYTDSLLTEDIDSDWYAYRLMSPIGNTSSIIEEHLYNKLRELRNFKNIYPTIDNKYTSINGYFFYDNADSSFWMEKLSSHSHNISKILKPVPKEYITNIACSEIKSNDLIIALNSISNILCDNCTNKEESIEKRAMLINHLVRSKRILNYKELKLIVNENNEIISNDFDIFAKKNNDVNFTFPNFVKIQFMNSDLFLRLEGYFREDDFYKDFLENADTKGEKPGRWLSKILRERIINQISDYDKDQVINVIVRQTNDTNNITETEDLKKQNIIDMIKCLYDIYSSSEFETFINNVQLIGSDNKIHKATELAFDNELNRSVFSDNITYLPIFSEIINNTQQYYVFFKHLGVNNFLETKVLNYTDYNNWLKNRKCIDKDKWLHPSMNEVKVIQLSNYYKNKLEATSLGQIIRILSNDNNLFKEIHKVQKLIIQKRPYSEIDTEYTYLRYQFLTLKNVKDKILPGETILDDISEDVKDIPNEKLSKVINFLTTNLNGYKPNEIADILNSLEGREIQKQLIRKTYKAIIDSLSKSDENLKMLDIKLYATELSGKSGFYPKNEVYYTDNAVPKTLIAAENKKKLYYGLRAGADKVCDTLGLTKISTSNLNITESSKHRSYQEFSYHFKAMKPYVLLYCLQNVNKLDEKKSLANILKNVEIEIVNKCRYSVGDKVLNLEDSEFISKDSTYYLKVNDSTNLEGMSKSVEYCNAIAEILSIICKLNGKNDIFISLFQNLEFMITKSKYEFSEDEINAAMELMGMSNEEYNFFRNLLGDNCPENGNNELIYNKALELLKLEKFNFNSVDFCKWLTSESKELLAKASQVNKDILTKVDLTFMHNQMVENVKNNLHCRFAHALWLYLNNREEEQTNYIKFLDMYEALSLELEINVLYTQEEIENIIIHTVKKDLGIEITEEKAAHFKQYDKIDDEIIGDDIINEFSNEERSLLLFKGNEEKLREIIKKLKNSHCTNDDLHEENNNKESSINAIFIDYNAISPKNDETNSVYSNDRQNASRNRTFSKSKAERNVKAGKDAEIKVKKVLEEAGYNNIEWISGFSDNIVLRNDTKGYDFTYEDKDGNKRFLEVKNFSSGSFILSANEYAVANTEENKNLYDIALVDGDDVYIIKSFFMKENFTKTANDYKISLNINKELRND